MGKRGVHHIHLNTTVLNTTTTYVLQQYTTISNTTPTTGTCVYLYACGGHGACVYSAVHTYSIPIYTPRPRWPPHWTKIKRGKKGNSIWGWKNIGFYGDFRRRMQSKHNSHVHIYPPGFIGSRGRSRVTKAIKWPFYLSRSRPGFCETMFRRCFELRHYAAVMRLAPPARLLHSLHTLYFIPMYNYIPQWWWCLLLLFPHENYSHYFL